ncbi:uncharacterized protein [Ptychodera flava]|uniref:uncharacterized protein n=1 Tax=Ptychodera flava TaxID=63121 RepID=UPI00396A0844
MMITMDVVESGDRGGGDYDSQEIELVETNDVVSSTDGGSDVELPLVYDTPRYTECQAYRMGMCIGDCAELAHPHINFPSSSKWEDRHMNRLRFTLHEFDSETGQEDDLIHDWLIGNITACGSNVYPNLNLPKYPASPAVAAARYETRMPVARYRELLSNHIRSNITEDNFLSVVKDFTDNNDMNTDDLQNLLAATVKDELNVPEAMKPLYRSFLMAWVTAFERFNKGKLPESYVDDLLAAVINIAACNTRCPVLVRVRESTARQVQMCGRYVNIQNGIEVHTQDQRGLLQVILFSKNKVFSKPNLSDVAKTIPQTACEALAVAKDSPFGNTFYKTVYQLSIHSVMCTDDNNMQFYAFLVKCHVSVDTLDGMAVCPIENPCQPSIIMYKRHACSPFRSYGFVSFMYKAVKAVMLAYQGVDVNHNE